MSPVLFLAQRLSAAILALAVAVHLATILYAVRGGLTAGEILARTHGNLAFLVFYSVFVAAVAAHAPIGLRNVTHGTGAAHDCRSSPTSSHWVSDSCSWKWR